MIRLHSEVAARHSSRRLPTRPLRPRREGPERSRGAPWYRPAAWAGSLLLTAIVVQKSAASFLRGRTYRELEAEDAIPMRSFPTKFERNGGYTEGVLHGVDKATRLQWRTRVARFAVRVGLLRCTVLAAASALVAARIVSRVSTSDPAPYCRGSAHVRIRGSRGDLSCLSTAIRRTAFRRSTGARPGTGRSDRAGVWQHCRATGQSADQSGNDPIAPEGLHECGKFIQTRSEDRGVAPRRLFA